MLVSLLPLPTLADGDLYISTVEFDPPTAVRGEKTKAIVTIRFRGDGTSDAFNVKWFPKPDEPGLSAEIDELKAGSSKTIEFTFTYRELGEFSSLVQIDTANTVDETNEANNKKRKSIDVIKGGVVRATTKPTVLKGCPRSVNKHYNMNNGGDVKIAVSYEIVDDKSVLVELVVDMKENKGSKAHGRLEESSIVTVEGLPHDSKIDTVLTPPFEVAFFDDNKKEDSNRDVIKKAVASSKVIKSLRVTAQTKGDDFDCDDDPYEDAYIEVEFNSLEVLVTKK